MKWGVGEREGEEDGKGEREVGRAVKVVGGGKGEREVGRAVKVGGGGKGEREVGRAVKVGGGGKGEGEGGEVEGEGGGKGRVEEEGEIMDLDEVLRRERQKEKRKIIAPEAQVSIVHKWQFVILAEYPILLLLAIQPKMPNFLCTKSCVL